MVLWLFTNKCQALSQSLPGVGVFFLGLMADKEEDTPKLWLFKAQVLKAVVLSQREKLPQEEHKKLKQNIEDLAKEVYEFCKQKGSSGMQDRLYTFASNLKEKQDEVPINMKDLRTIFGHLNRGYIRNKKKAAR